MSVLGDGLRTVVVGGFAWFWTLVACMACAAAIHQWQGKVGPNDGELMLGAAVGMLLGFPVAGFAMAWYGSRQHRRRAVRRAPPPRPAGE